MSRFLTLLGLGALMLTLSTAAAQPDPALVPTFGTVSLTSGFTPDPHTVEVNLGSSGVEAPAEAGCPGTFQVAPDVDLQFETDGVLPLHLYVRSSTDTVLLVNLPDGSWVCNDDGNSLDPDLLMDDPQEGLYDIWVGSYSAAGEGSATLYISEFEEAEMMVDAAPSDASIHLDSGFEPDPHSVDVTAGGSDLVPYEGCNGYVDSAAPDAGLVLETDGTLPLYIYAEAAEGDDLTLTVVTPEGDVLCNDDAVDLNPGLVMDTPTTGRYAIWVGTFASRSQGDSDVPATLYFSEVEGPTIDGGDDFGGDMDFEYSGGEELSVFAAPSHGTVSLAPGFLPDPHDMMVEAGGSDGMPVSGPGCAGSIDAAAPTMNLMYDEGGSTLAFYLDSEIDTTLLISLPDGSWLCSDDELGRNPAIVVDDPSGGLYNVWVGSYSQDNAGASATVHLSETDPR